MTQDQALILLILAGMMALFLWGRFRHDIVALAALLASVLTGLVPGSDAFAGFGHPAVITVASVLILSRALQVSGAVDWLARSMLPAEAARSRSMGGLMGLGAGLSAFMNNVGAMALLMPVATQMARRLNLTPGQLLMPLAFATILGGMVTLIGTPPNLIVAGFRDGGFAMFDFAWVGLPVAVSGVLFVVAVGWRLVPARRAADADGFQTAAYLTEVEVPKGAKADGQTLRAVEEMLSPAEAQIVALIRDGTRLTAPHRGRKTRAGDILVIEAKAEGLPDALVAGGLRLLDGERLRERPRDDDDDSDTDDEVLLREYVIMPGAVVDGRSARNLQLRSGHGLNLLGVSRSGRRPAARLGTLALRSGDVVLMQGRAEALGAFAADHGLVPLAGRDLRLPDSRAALTAAGVMLGSVGLAAAGLVPAAVAFALGVLGVMVLRLVPLHDLYTAVDWPVIVLLAALIPVAGAMEDTGTAALIAQVLVGSGAQGAPLVALAVVLVVTMVLSDVMNNAATAAVMCPVAIGIADTLGVSPDPLLMGVAVGASCAFLTPIGHQNNTLILGPGGFGFGDYWRLGVPLQGMVCAVALPLLPLVWPF